MSQLLTFDTSKRTFSSITLEHSSPSAIYPLKDKNLLFIEHTDYQFSPISFTIYNAETGEQVFHTLKELNPRPHYLEHVHQMDNRRLMMILCKRPITKYIEKGSKVLSTLEPFSIYILS